MQHIIAPFNEITSQPWHQDIWHAFLLAKRLGNQRLSYQFWSPDQLSAAAIAALGQNKMSIQSNIKVIETYRGIVPNDGHLWIAGATHIGPWYDYLKYQTISVIYDTINSDQFFRHLQRLSKNTSSMLNVFRISSNQVQKSGLPSQRLAFEIRDIDIWSVNELLKQDVDRAFTVGRLSPDLPEWHHFDDPALYEVLGSKNIQIKLAGADSIKSRIKPSEKIEFYDFQQPMEKFIAYLDCLICRSSPHRPKNFIPIISMAMKYGIPIITNPKNSFAESLKQYPKTYILNTNDEILKAVITLSKNK